MSFEQILQLAQVVLVPIIMAVMALAWRAMDKAEKVKELLEQVRAHAARDLADYKLEVAKSYVHIDYLRDVERRLTEHLLRIEAKLDVKPMAAAE